MRILLLFLVVAWVTVNAPVSAQNWTPEQQEIWRLEEEMWQRDTAKDLTWIDTYIHADAMSWGIGEPVPRNKASIVRWDKYEYDIDTVLEHELFPLSITVTGDVAVVHYRYRIANENDKKERKTVTGRYSDMLVKDGGRWLIIAAVGGDDPRSAE